MPLWPEGSGQSSCQLSGWPPYAVPGRTRGFAPFYKECGLAVGRRRPTHRGLPGYVLISLPETTCSHGEGGADPHGPVSRGASKEGVLTPMALWAEVRARRAHVSLPEMPAYQ